MNDNATQSWCPTRIIECGHEYRTLMRPLRVETDDGTAVVKMLDFYPGSMLACEWVGTLLASAIGLPTPQAAIIPYAGHPPLEFWDGETALPAPAFASRWEDAQPWRGGAAELDRLENQHDFARFIVFDTWTRNAERHFVSAQGACNTVNLDNVLIVEGTEDGKTLIKSIDHGGCFVGGTELDSKVLSDSIQDASMFGQFPLFCSRTTWSEIRAACRAISLIDRDTVEAFIDSVPKEWIDVDPIRAAWTDFILARGAIVEELLTTTLVCRTPPRQQSSFLQPKRGGV